jgi:ribA/ribD-fused uncharacterized protein
MSSEALKEFYAKRSKELLAKKGKGGIGTYHIYDEEGNLVTKNKEGGIQQTVTIPSYRPLSLEEMAIMEKERQDRIAAATKAYDDAYEALHNESQRKDRLLQKVMELNRQMEEADHHLQYARYPVRYVAREDGVEIRRIDFDQPAEVRKLPYSLACQRVNPFPLQEMYVREGKPPAPAPEAAPEAVATKPVLFIQEAGTNENGFMALDWPVQIRLRSVTYHSAKQALAAELAKTFGDDDGFRRIMDAESPTEVSYTLEHATEEKKEVTPDTWAANTKRFLYEIQQAKFDQYPELRGRLLATGDAVLAVYQPGDELLGIGISTDDVHAKNPIYWKGQNLLGSVLMEIRGKFREAQPAPSAPAVVPKKKFSVRRPVVAASSAPFIITNHLDGHETAIPGLYYIPNALTVAQEKELIDYLDGPKASWEGVTGSATARRVQHYGYRYDYKRRTVSGPTHLIPEQWKSVIGLGYQWNQVIVNEYDPGQGISAHIDAPVYGDTIICYTLGSGATMRFTKPETGEVVDLYVAPRSVYIMSDAARYGWKHEMISRKTNTVDGKTIPRSRRISVTLRWVPEGSLASASASASSASQGT